MKTIIKLSIFSVLLVTNVQAQNGAYDPYDYNHWLNGFSLMSWLPGQTGTITIQGQEYDADLVFSELIRIVNWSLDLKYEGRLDLWLFNYTGAFTRSYDLSDESDDMTFLVIVKTSESA